MKAYYLLAALSAFSLATSAYADGDMSRANPEEIVLEMGQTDMKHMFFKPNHLELHTGKAYKIVLKNTDKIKHEFAAPELMARVFTRKVEVIGSDGKMIAEIKGGITEVELAPGGVAEWFIVPIQTGENVKMVCELAGHEEAGMHGTVDIK